MAKKIESIKHNKDKRAHIPSKEEAGYEEANPKVQQGKKTLELPKNPVVHRGQDPELFWLNKYGNDDREDLLRVDIRSLYRHEHIAPETLIENLYKVTEVPSAQGNLFNDLFGNALKKDELQKVSEYYHHQDGWTNRLIQGDSHLVMASLLEREGMAGQVQMIYIDPPYGIKYGSNWQVKLNNRDVKDGADENLASEPEVIKAFRDTWELGIHSYLSYLRDRLLVAKELLTESGSCFVQISDENVHLVRCIMDEVFGSENFISLITFQTAANQNTDTIQRLFDHIIWYAKSIDNIKVRKLYRERTDAEMNKVFSRTDEKGVKYKPDEINSFDATQIKRLKNLGRISIDGKHAKLFHTDFPVTALHNVWTDTVFGHAKKIEKMYVVQTNKKVIERCVLMTTDPGDLVLDPTCGSGTTAYVAEQWGRRWITIDTSRIAINIAKTRLMTAVYPYYHLYSDVEVTKEEKDGKIKKTLREKPEHERTGDIRQGFVYEEVPHITLKSLANDEPPETETLYDKPYEDKNKLRVSGPFTVETLQNYEPIPVDSEQWAVDSEDTADFTETVRQHLVSAGIKNGRKEEQVIFTRVDLLSHPYLHAEGFYTNGTGEKKAYIHIGPKFGTVSKTAVNEAIKECRLRGDAQWLIILGFSFESDIEGSTQTTSLGKFEVTKARIHDDLLQEGLKKKPGQRAASFVTIGEPDIEVVDSGQWLVDSNNKLLCNYDIFKKLSGIDSLAKVNGLSQADLSAYVIFSQRRDVWIDFSNAKGSSKHFGKHSGGSSQKQHGEVFAVFGDSQRFFSGIDDFNHFIGELGLSDERKLSAFVAELRRSRKDAEWLAEITFTKELTTKHYKLITIQGLDIYDPIEDVVKARNVSDIAYWMVDDDYDGSNFIVKQVFFCGGDKDEFDKWKKGLESLAKDSTKKKVEKTLKIEIDDEAFDRLYGYISHPIEVKKKGQKIAVRVISQFGEETTKVLTV